MTDRELMELAGKAAGYALEWQDNCVFVMLDGPRRGNVWRPLDFDGDAFRLAADLPRLEVERIIGDAWEAHDNGPDRWAYIRRSLVVAAGELAGNATLGASGVASDPGSIPTWKPY